MHYERTENGYFVSFDWDAGYATLSLGYNRTFSGPLKAASVCLNRARQFREEANQLEARVALLRTQADDLDELSSALKREHRQGREDAI